MRNQENEGSGWPGLAFMMRTLAEAAIIAAQIAQ
jgi:hypothetical protein